MKFLSGPKFQLDHAGILEGMLSSYECMQAWSSDLDKPACLGPSQLTGNHSLYSGGRDTLLSGGTAMLLEGPLVHHTVELS